MDALRHVLAAVQWGFLGYFILLNAIYLALASIAIYRLRRYMGGVAAAERVYTHLQMPVSLVVPEGVSVRKVDLAVELQILTYYEQRKAALAEVKGRRRASADA